MHHCLHIPVGISSSKSILHIDKGMITVLQKVLLWHYQCKVFEDWISMFSEF